jgi:hypothetical protein
MDAIEAYREAHGRQPFRMEDAAQWILDTGLLPAPKINAARLLTRRLKQIARRNRFRDPQGRKVRTAIAAKIKRLGAKDNMILDVVWDWLHEMSLDHALLAFSQRDSNILKQRRAATREVHSFLENNPNAAGHADKFKQLSFLVDEPAEVIEEQIEESAVRPQRTTAKRRKPR